MTPLAGVGVAFPAAISQRGSCPTRRLRSNDRKPSGVAVNSSAGGRRSSDRAARRAFARSQTSSRCRSRACSDFAPASSGSSAHASTLSGNEARLTRRLVLLLGFGAVVVVARPGRAARSTGALVLARRRRSCQWLTRAARDQAGVDFTPTPSKDRASTFLTLAGTGAFDAGLDRLVARAASFQDRVREDLQHGVINALHDFLDRQSPGSRSPSDRLR
jgi:hypothetical protein